MCISVRARWSAAHSAVADGPRAGLQPLKSDQCSQVAQPACRLGFRAMARHPRQHQAHVMCINVRIRWSAAHSALADGPRAGLQPLKWEPGDERPACAGLSAGSPVAGATVGWVSTAAMELPATLSALSCCCA